MASAAQWIQGARPRTLPAAMAPVAVGTGAAYAVERGSVARGLLALVVALALQVAVNYANDYSDGVRGTDAARVGPLRLVGSGAARPEAVRGAAVAAFAVAAVAGTVLVWSAGAWELLPVGVACIAAAWFYTGGSRPYGYSGLGELFVFVFFGLVAVVGTTFTQVGAGTWASLWGGCGVGALACAILVANNLRDVPTDAATGKRTLAVRIGDRRSRLLYVVLVVAALGSVVLVAAAAGSAWPLVAVLAAALAVPPVRVVLGGAGGRELVPVLGATGRLELVYGVLLGLGLAAA